MTSLSTRVVVATSKVTRSLGKVLDDLGKQLEVAKYTERLVPSTRFVAVDDVSPSVSPNATFVAPSASVIGNVTLEENSSIWYGATVRGDVNKVTIGTKSSVGDRAVIHVAKIQGDFPTIIGSNVSIGPGSIIHAATLKDDCIIGPLAQVLDGAVIESKTIIAPGSIITPGTVVNSGLWAGSPAKFIRELTPEEVKMIEEAAEEKLESAKLHAIECAKDYKQIAEDEDLYEDELYRDPDYWQRNDPNVNKDEVNGQGVPGMIFDNVLTHPERAGELKDTQTK